MGDAAHRLALENFDGPEERGARAQYLSAHALRQQVREGADMRILIVTQYFWPENFRVNDLVEELVRRGHQVTVLTGLPNYPGGQFFEGYGLAGPYREERGGAHVVRVPLVPRGGGSRFRLALNYLSFALWRASSHCCGSVEISTLTLRARPSPVTVGLPAILMKRRAGAPIVFWVLDLWPESVAATAAVRLPRVLAWIGELVRFIYRRCDRILVSSRGFVPKVVAAGGDERTVALFPELGGIPLRAAAARDTAAGTAAGWFPSDVCRQRRRRCRTSRRYWTRRSS